LQFYISAYTTLNELLAVFLYIIVVYLRIISLIQFNLIWPTIWWLCKWPWTFHSYEWSFSGP